METGFGNDALGAKARAFYEAGIKEKVEPEHYGKYLVIDVGTGEYDFDTDDYAVSMRTYEKNPQGVRVCVRIGYRATGNFRAVNVAGKVL